MTTATCPNCNSDVRVHYFAANWEPDVLVTRCGGCGWRRESDTHAPSTSDAYRLAEQWDRQQPASSL